MQTVYSADKIFTGYDWLPDHAVVIDDDIIIDVIPLVSLSENVVVKRHYPMIAPSFIDMQIYGAGGKLFASYPETSSLKALHAYCVSGGANNFLPTVATNSMDVFFKCIDAVRDYWDEGGKGVPGLHLEGPWINVSKRGAHIEKFIHAPEKDEVSQLLEYGKGVIKMITLAPEIVNENIIRMIIQQDIIISAGHSDSTFTQAGSAFDNGVEAVTHLFNAMSPLHHREPGLAAAAFRHPSVVASIIPDGFHVDYEMIRIAKQLMGDRLFVITDAVTDSQDGSYQHRLKGSEGEWRYEYNGVLSGSALTMIQAVKNLVHRSGIEVAEALRMASLYPARLLGTSNVMGMIRKGYRAELVFLDDNLNVI